MRNLSILAIAVLGLALFGCTQPPVEIPTATPTTEARMYQSVSIGTSSSAEVPTGWAKKQGTVMADASFTDSRSGSVISFASLPMEDETLENFANGQLEQTDNELSINPLALAFARNLGVNRFGERDWYVACYTFTDETGKDFEQCSSFTACGTNSGIVLVSAEGKGELKTQIPSYRHALETYKC
ncbi:MAG: hypothetical protein ABH863_04610 [Candidatus Micrarchaeota archaeon]